MPKDKLFLQCHLSGLHSDRTSGYGPYISKVLNPEVVGQFSFTDSLQSYFTLLAALGFGYYAQRKIANHQNDRKCQTLIFWEIILIRLISVAFAILPNTSLCFAGVYKTYKELMMF